MVDISCETPLTFNQAAEFLPEANRPNYSTWWRWWRVGVRGVKLETVMVGGRRMTTRAAVERFCAAITAASTPGAPAVVTADAKRRDAWADEVLSAAGI